MALETLLVLLFTVFAVPTACLIVLLCDLARHYWLNRLPRVERRTMHTVKGTHR